MADQTRRRLTPLNDQPRNSSADLNPSLSRDGYRVINRAKQPGGIGSYYGSNVRPELEPLAQPVFDGPNIPLNDDR